MKKSIIIRLFKKSFFSIAISYFIMILLFIGIINLKNAYKLSLQEEFATKQPHIKIKYINNSSFHNIQKDLNYIKSLSNKIDTISPFVEGEKFFNSIGFKEGGYAQYNGDIKIIGLGTKNLVYDFFNSQFIPREPFDVPYTPLEFFYAFKNKPDIVVFNKTLTNSYFPVIESTENFEFKHNFIIQNAKLAAIFNDYDKTPTLYTNIKFANKLLSQNINKIDGFFINAKNLNEIDKLTKFLKSHLPKDKFIVSSYLELRQKQFSLFEIYQSLSFIIVGVLLILTILFILLLLYHAIIKKSYQLSVLYTLGYNLKNDIFIMLFIIIFFVSFIDILIIHKYLPILINYFNLPFTNYFFIQSVIYIFIINSIFLVISYFLIHNAYKIKTKSVFS